MSEIMTLEEQIAWVGAIQYWFQKEADAENLQQVKESLRRLHAIDQAQEKKDAEAKDPKDKYPNYQAFVAVYMEFFQGYVGVSARIQSGDGRAMKAIIKYLIQESKANDEEGALDAWRYILGNWTKLTDFIQKQTALTQINKNLLEILTQLRHGRQQKTGANTAETIKSRIIRRQAGGDGPQHHQP